jgi:hypothetical protein
MLDLLLISVDFPYGYKTMTAEPHLETREVPEFARSEMCRRQWPREDSNLFLQQTLLSARIV